MFPPSPSCCLTTPPISTTTRTMLPRKHGPPGMPPSASRAGITSSQPSGSLKSERSESERAGIEPPFELAALASVVNRMREGHLIEVAVLVRDAHLPETLQHMR